MVSHNATCTILCTNIMHIYHTLLPALVCGIRHFYLHYIMVSHTATCTILWYHTLLTKLYYGITHCYLHLLYYCITHCYFFMFIDIDNTVISIKIVVTWGTPRMVMVVEMMAMLGTFLSLVYLLPVVCTGPQTSRGRDNFPRSKILSDSFKMIKKTV